MKALRILILSHSFYPSIGGIEINSEILAKGFQEAGHQVHLLTWSADPSKKIFPFRVIRSPNKFRLLCEHAWANVVFENNPSLRLAWPNIFYKKSSVVALRTWIHRSDGRIGWQDKLKILWLRRASGVIAVSEAVRKQCCPAARVIGNPYRLDLFRILPDVPRTADFVFFGRLVSDKGADLAIKAFHRLLTSKDHSKSATSKLTIIGDGPERQRLEDMVSELSMKGKVEFTGSLRGELLVICLNRHRFLLVPSLWEEPFGNVALEGMACGCLPIVSDGGGLPDAVGSAGLTFRRGNIDDFVACLQKILNDTDLEQQLRNAIPGHLAAHHPEVVSRQYLDVIEKAVSQK